jgi:hypothetical protein
MRFLATVLDEWRSVKNLEFFRDYGQGLNLRATDTRARTGIGLGHYQQEISDRESTIMPYIENFGLYPDEGLDHGRKFQLINMSK